MRLALEDVIKNQEWLNLALSPSALEEWRGIGGKKTICLLTKWRKKREIRGRETVRVSLCVVQGKNFEAADVGEKVFADLQFADKPACIWRLVCTVMTKPPVSYSSLEAGWNWFEDHPVSFPWWYFHFLDVTARALRWMAATWKRNIVLFSSLPTPTRITPPRNNNMMFPSGYVCSNVGLSIVLTYVRARTRLRSKCWWKMRHCDEKSMPHRNLVFFLEEMNTFHPSYGRKVKTWPLKKMKIWENLFWKSMAVDIEKKIFSLPFLYYKK